MSSENFKLYKSLGALIKDYRQFHALSQERFAELISISVRELRRWEAAQRRARIENLHDLSEVAGIPMQVCVTLNADQPIWYSLRRRLFAHSSIEVEQFVMRELLRYRRQSEDPNYRKSDQIATDKHINAIILYHRDFYGTKKILERDVIKTAGMILPDLNRVFFDSWGHYAGHLVCLPLKKEVYRQLKKQETLEDYLATERISNIVSLQGGVFLFYSFAATNSTTARQQITECENYFAKIEQKKKYMVAFYSATIESNEFFNDLGMRLALTIDNDKNRGAQAPLAIHEIELSALMRPIGPFGDMGWVVKEQPLHKSSSWQTLGSEMLNVDEMPIVDINEQDNLKGINTQNSELRTEACSNPKCSLQGKTGRDNIISNGTYRTKKGTLSRRFLCKECGVSSCSRGGTIFYDLRSPEAKVLKALELLVKGMSLRHAAKTVGVQYHTIGRWLKLAAAESEKIETMLLRELNVSKFALDALWTSVRENSLRQRAILWKRKGSSVCCGDKTAATRGSIG